MKRVVELEISGYPVRIELAADRITPKVVCLGPEGTYTEAARYGLLKGYLDKMEASFLPTNAEVVRKVEAGDYDIGIVPVENSTEGDVIEVLRELNHITDATILGEHILAIQHMLIGWPKQRIDEVHSHPQALGQCRTWLLDNFPNVKQVPTTSTTAAVILAKENERIAAIASERAAQIHNLDILARDIGDIKGNSTRFLMLGRGETYPTGNDNTAIILTVEDHPGVLADCLVVLKNHSINLTKIDSRPTGKLGEYAFWITMDGHRRDERVKESLDELSRYCQQIRILGSYRKAELPIGARDPGAINGI